MSGSPAPGIARDADALGRLDATAQAELVRRGEVSPPELVEAAIARIERRDPVLNAVILPRFARARAEAAARDLPAGPFRGVPMAIKDLGCHTAGDPFHQGMRCLKEAGWTEPDDTYLAAKLRRAGFVFVGRTNTPELGPMTGTEPHAYGPSRNPWNPDYSTGGSSGGSAAAVAAGMVPVAHAGDGGGSIRIPASACGLVGLKPSRGRTSLGPDIGESWAGLVVEHVVARSVRDTAAVLDVVAGPMPGDPCVAPAPARPFAAEVGADPGRLRIGVLAHVPAGTATVHPDCVAGVAATARLLASLGHDVEEAFPTALGDRSLQESATTIVCACIARDLAYWGARLGRPLGADDVEPVTWAIGERGRQVSAADYILAVEHLHRAGRDLATWWAGGFDLLLTPTMPEPPPPIGTFRSRAEAPLETFGRSGVFVAFTAAYNVSGQPAISLPLAWSASGLPIGMQLVAAYGREDVLVRVAAQLEEASPWAERWPACAA